MYVCEKFFAAVYAVCLLFTLFSGRMALNSLSAKTRLHARRTAVLLCSAAALLLCCCRPPPRLLPVARLLGRTCAATPGSSASAGTVPLYVGR